MSKFSFYAITVCCVSFGLMSCGGNEPEGGEPATPTGEPTFVAAQVEVIDYAPAPGQFVNELPRYEEGDTREDMIRKANESIKTNGMVCLGGWGGSITMRLSQPIVNVEGKPDFRVLGNAFYASGIGQAEKLGSSEPGIILVMEDKNGNGLADDGEWIEIAGEVTKEAIADYTVTYNRPAVESEDPNEEYILWTDNKGGSGYVVKNPYHAQPYYPQWISDNKLIFSGRRLPDNGFFDEENGMWYQRCYLGYVDAYSNISDESLINLDNAIDSSGNPVKVTKIDFIKVYTGVLQDCGIIGETSTEVTGVQRAVYDK